MGPSEPARLALSSESKRQNLRCSLHGASCSAGCGASLGADLCLSSLFLRFDFLKARQFKHLDR